MVEISFLKMGIVTWDNVLFVCIEYSSNELNLSQSYETKKTYSDVSKHFMGVSSPSVSFTMQPFFHFQRIKHYVKISKELKCFKWDFC